MMPLCGTFDYVATVPDRSDGGLFECRAHVREPVVWHGNDLRDARLVGIAPMLRVTDAGLTPETDTRRPWVMRSRIALAASSRQQATVAAAFFHVDRALTSNLRSG